MAAAIAGRMAERKGGGRLVLISSAAAFHALPFAASYAGSKAGLSRFTDSLRIAMRPRFRTWKSFATAPSIRLVVLVEFVLVIPEVDLSFTLALPAKTNFIPKRIPRYGNQIGRNALLVYLTRSF